MLLFLFCCSVWLLNDDDDDDDDDTQLSLEKVISRCGIDHCSITFFPPMTDIFDLRLDKVSK